MISIADIRHTVAHLANQKAVLPTKFHVKLYWKVYCDGHLGFSSSIRKVHLSFSAKRNAECHYDGGQLNNQKLPRPFPVSVL